LAEDRKLTEPVIVPLADPDQLPIRVVNDMATLDFLGGLFDLVLMTTFPGVDPEGKLQAQRIIAARLRFDLDFARAFHAQLGQAIEALTSPPKDQVN
jgi:hypothetical protein